MRIAYLSADFGVAINGSSGSSIHIREVTRVLRTLGHEVRIFSTSRYPVDQSSEDDRLQIIRLEGFGAAVAASLEDEDLGELTHIRREFRRILYSEYLQRALLPVLSDFAPHFIYERYSLFSYAGVELARTLGLPLVLEVNAPLAREAAQHRDLLFGRTAEQVEMMIWSRADRVLVVSTALRAHA